MPAFAFIGFGELGVALARGLTHSGAHGVRAFTRARADPAAASALEQQFRAARTIRAGSIESALTGAAAVLVVVPSSASSHVFEESVPHLTGGMLYADMTAAHPASKEQAAVRAGKRGALYVDVAVLGTVAASGFEVPLLASGPGASEFRELMRSAGMRVDAIEAPAGHATLVKLLRSVYMKGRDALVLEMVLAARHYGLTDVVLESIGGPGENVPFPALAERVLTALAVHAGRRADELAASGEVVQAAGVAPLITRAGAERLQWLAELGVREAFHRERPPDSGAVLAMIDELLRVQTDGSA